MTQTIENNSEKCIVKTIQWHSNPDESQNRVYYGRSRSFCHTSERSGKYLKEKVIIRLQYTVTHYSSDWSLCCSAIMVSRDWKDKVRVWNGFRGHEIGLKMMRKWYFEFGKEILNCVNDFIENRITFVCERLLFWWDYFVETDTKPKPNPSNFTVKGTLCHVHSHSRSQPQSAREIRRTQTHRHRRTIPV